MKKSLLLAAAALFGLAPQASALVQLTNDNCATEIKDGHVLALQCLDTNGGLWKFWNGCQLKSDNFNPATGFLQIEFNGEVQRDGRQTFYLKNYANPSQYLSNTAGNSSVAQWTTDKSAAAQWTAYVPVMNSTNYDVWSSKPMYLDRAENTVRLDKGGGSFLNTNDKNSNPKYAGGKGGYSYWYVYVFTPEEAEAITEGSAPSPKMITCNYLYSSPKRDVYFKGMPFAVLEGTDVSALKYYEHYEGAVENFSHLALEEGQDFIATESNNEFKLSMTPSDAWEAKWDAWMEKYNSYYKLAHRAQIKPVAGTESYISYSNIYEGELRSQNPNKLFGASHMWYLEYAGLDMYGEPAVKFMSVQYPGQGIEIGSDDDSHATVSSNPTIFSMFESTVEGHLENDFVLGAVDMNSSSRNFLNDRTATVPSTVLDENGNYPNITVHFFSTWKATVDQAKQDNGCRIRFLDLDDSEFDDYKVEVHACGYPEYLAKEGKNNGVDLSNEAFAKAKETKLPEDVTKLFPENANLLLGLRTYLDYTGIAFYENRRINGANGEEDFYGIPGYVQDGEVVNLYNALDAFDVNNKETWTPVARARWNLVNAATQPVASYDITPGAIFNMRNVDENRGYLVATDGKLETSTVSGRQRSDIDSPDFNFTFVKVGDKLYMYSLGAEKFLNCFGQKTDHTGPMVNNVSDFTWQLSDVPSEIRYADRHSGADHAFLLAGGMKSGNATGDGYFTGKTPSQVHEGGICMMSSYQRGVIASLGVDGREDGSGLIADYVGFVSEEDYQAIVEKAEMAIAAIPSETLDWDDIDGVVNHLTKESHALIAQTASEANKAVNGGGHDHIHYALQNAERQGFEADKVYNFFVDTNNALKVDGATGALVVDEFAADNTSFNLKVVEAAAPADVYMDTPETKTYNFLHTIQDENGNGEAQSMSYNGTTDHVIDMSELGKVKVNGETFVAKVGTGDATTGISEITATSGAMNVYDLQGRKLAAPAKGINIINGTKVLVK